MAGDQINTTILGAAGEHYVMCQLLRRGMIAALAPAGIPDADIIVSAQHDRGRLLANVPSRSLGLDPAAATSVLSA